MAATPLYFGDSARKLYGVFHHPEKRTPNAPAVLLFNPFGEEAIRASRIFKQLAERLARAGASVLRFDYFGSGDSDGDCSAVDLFGMIRDAETAHEELEAMTGARRFVWIGLGLGGAVALRAAQQSDVTLAKLILWDPVLDGEHYLAELRQAHVSMLAHVLDAPLARIDRETPASPFDLAEAMGFSLSPALRAQLRDFKYSGDCVIAQEIHVVGSHEATGASCANQSLERAAEEIFHFDNPSMSWNSIEAMNAYYVPADIIDYVARATEARR